MNRSSKLCPKLIWTFVYEPPGNFYCPQRSCGKVMFLHLFVILFTDTPSWADTTLGRPPRRRPLQRTVRIILECILVFSFLHFSDWWLIGVTYAACRRSLSCSFGKRRGIVLIHKVAARVRVRWSQNNYWARCRSTYKFYVSRGYSKQPGINLPITWVICHSLIFFKSIAV